MSIIFNYAFPSFAKALELSGQLRKLKSLKSRVPPQVSLVFSSLGISRALPLTV